MPTLALQQTHTLSPHLPPQVARSRASECIPALIGRGSRMEVYPLVDEQTVLRVPRRSEPHLIDESGSSGRTVLADGNEISNVTDAELDALDTAEGYIGAFMPPTTPLPDLDLDGTFRYYTVQKRVWPTRDLRVCTERLEGAQSRRSLERFVRDVRDMVAHAGLMPDLAGRGNLVLDRYGLVKLVDINNFRPLVGTDTLHEALAADPDLDACAAGRRDVRGMLPSGFLDDHGQPIADLSLAGLRVLEVQGLGRDRNAVDADPFYAPLADQKRRVVLALLRADMA